MDLNRLDRNLPFYSLPAFSLHSGILAARFIPSS